MKANIYLHIGLHKTGTTSIQATLFKNRKKLLAHGINYLPLGENHSTSLYPLLMAEPEKYRLNRLAGIDTTEKAAKKNAATDAALRRALQSNTCNSVVISGEDLSGLPSEGLQRLKDKLAPYAARFRVIVYIREPRGTVTSMFQQRLRRGQTYDRICRRPPRPGYPRIGVSIEVFGRDNVDIRVFDKALDGGDLIGDFLAAIGADPGLAKHLVTERANVGLSHEAAWLMQAINKNRPENSLATRHDIGGWLAQIPGQPYRVPPEVFACAEPLIAEDLKWLRALLGSEVFPGGPQTSESLGCWQENSLAAIALLFDDMAKQGPKRGRPTAWIKAIWRRFAPASFRG